MSDTWVTLPEAAFKIVGMVFTVFGLHAVSGRARYHAKSNRKSGGTISTGYADLDKLLHGGLPREYAVVLTSRSCDERSLLVQRFLEAGTGQGEGTFLVTIDTGMCNCKWLVEEFPSTFYLLLCNPQADAIAGSLPNVFKTSGVDNLTNINMALTSAIRKIDAALQGPRRICIDVISDVLLQHRVVQTRRWLAALIPELRSKGFTTLAVIDPEMHPPQEVRAILDLFDGEISIYEKETEKGLEKYLRIRKMGNYKYADSELPLRKENLQ